MQNAAAMRELEDLSKEYGIVQRIMEARPRPFMSLPEKIKKEAMICLPPEGKIWPVATMTTFGFSVSLDCFRNYAQSRGVRFNHPC